MEMGFVPVLPPPVGRVNSAGRLVAIIESLKRIQPQGDAYDRTILKAFSPRFVDPSRIPDSLVSIASMRVSDQIQEVYFTFLSDVDRQLPEDSRLVLLKGLTRLSDSLFPRNRSGSIISPNDAEISLLEMAVTLIEPEGVIEDSEIETIRKMLSEIRSLVVKSDEFPASFKSAVLDVVRLGEMAISQYNNKGARGFKRFFNEMLGETLSYYRSDSEVVNESPQTKHVWSKVISVLVFVDNALGRALKYKAIGHEALKFIGAVPESDPKV